MRLEASKYGRKGAVLKAVQSERICKPSNKTPGFLSLEASIIGDMVQADYMGDLPRCT